MVRDWPCPQVVSVQLYFSIICTTGAEFAAALEAADGLKASGNAFLSAGQLLEAKRAYDLVSRLLLLPAVHNEDLSIHISPP